MKSFSQFGSDLDASTLAILKHGEALMSMLKQNQYSVYQLDKQVFDLFVAKNKFLDDLNKDIVRKTLDEAYNVFKATHQDVLDNINKNKQISDEDASVLLKEMQEFFENLNIYLFEIIDVIYHDDGSVRSLVYVVVKRISVQQLCNFVSLLCAVCKEYGIKKNRDCNGEQEYF